ncbi:ABC transporter substrate-binding protein [Sphingomonas bacterium]|uniref:ABC transporter substrate-binding protein n=1 Tax=Sphingomonas bacterium TaxID=1895847 RepID=UPI0026357A7C|nr:ABC transporter substrate-binding protein [Sphingomonas bacterium]MDB5679195.1 transporter substrate-binding protein [Sphingomonas bacterium]
MRAGVALIALVLAGCNAQPAGIGGIVSTNPCADQLLLALAPPGRIAAISHYSQEEAATSIPLDVARRFRGTAGTAEEVIALKPDLVLASSFTPAATLRAYQRLGLKVLLLDSPTTIAASRGQIRQVAAALGTQAAGERLIARIDVAVAAAAPKDAARPSALLFISENFANGGPTLLTEMLGRAGFGTNAKATASGAIPIERVMRDPPAVILDPDPDGRTATLRRRVLARAGLRVAEARFPRSLVNCGGPTIIPAMQRLAAIRANIVR